MISNQDALDTEKRGNLDFVQVLRGIAAVMVVLLHIWQHQAVDNQNSLFQWVALSGGAGVPLFFIISGFIMVYATRSIKPDMSSAVTFIIKRFARVWPTYIVLTVLFWLVVNYADQLIGAKFPYGARDIVLSLFFIPINLASDAPILGGSVLNPGWSLNYEIYFYIIFATCMLFGRFRWVAFFSFLVATLIFLPIAFGHRPGLDASLKYGFSSYLALMTSPMIWEFAAGVFIGLIYFSRIRFPNKKIAAFSCAFTAALVVWIMLSKAFWGMGMNEWGWSLALMFLCMAIASKTINLPAPKALVWLGNISYSLYLVHPFFIKPVFDIVWETSYRAAIRDPSFILVVLTASIGAAALSREYLELRLSDYVKNKLLRRAQSINSSQKHGDIISASENVQN